MEATDREIAIRTWEFRERELPRVPPDGWADTTDRLRETVCLIVEHTVDGVERVEPFEGYATDTERFDASVTVDEIDHELVQLIERRSQSESDGGDGTADSTQQFDLDQALDRL